jgi:ribosome-binding protein aMBF1 (putative translation factor)
MALKTIDVLLEELAIGLNELADRAGLPIERVAAIADGRWTPSPREREKLAAALGVQITEVSWGHTMNPRNVRYHRFGLKEDFQANPGSNDRE